MKIIGVTGGIGSGKSTVSKMLEQQGAKIVDADAVAREVVRKGGKALAELVAHFGPEILDTNGELDRKKLGGIVFNSKSELSILNDITHKYIVEEMIERVNSLKKDADTGLIVVEAPIPVEHGFLDVVDTVWVVTADVETRISRVMKRNGLSYGEVADRIASQQNTEGYLEIADRVLVNDGDKESLRQQVEELI